MGLSGLEIYKLLKKTNCKECGFPTCLAFAMQLAQKKISLDKCPHVSPEAKAALESASEPPIRLVRFGPEGRVVAIGNETVMFRHEEKFHHQTAIGLLMDKMDEESSARGFLKEAAARRFHRVGQDIFADLVFIDGEGRTEQQFLGACKAAADCKDIAIALGHNDAGVMAKALAICGHIKPLIGYCGALDSDQWAELSKKYTVPVIARAPDLGGAEEVVRKLNAKGVKDIVIMTGTGNVSARVWELTVARRMALKRSYRTLGYPQLVFAAGGDPFMGAAESVTFLCKYAGIVVMPNSLPWQVLSVLTARQNIYTDPQKPLCVKAGIYQVGPVTQDSPVLVTTNFSLTYYTVEAEIEASKKPAYIIACDADGMSVLTAWAADKFTADTISKVLKSSGITDKVSHRTIVLPGYVAVLSAKLEEASGWKVVVGPREASSIPSFLRNYKG